MGLEEPQTPLAHGIGTASWPWSGCRSSRQAFPKPSSQDTFPHVCVGPRFGLLVKKGDLGSSWMHSPVHLVSPDPVGRAGEGHFLGGRVPGVLPGAGRRGCGAGLAT